MKNKEKLLENQKDYRVTNKETLYEKHKDYRIKNREKLNAKSLAYHSKNKEKTMLQNKEYRTRNQETLNEKQREKYLMEKKEKNENFILKKTQYSWNDKDSVKRFFESKINLFHISDLSDWYRISMAQIKKAGGNFFLLFILVLVLVILILHHPTLSHTSLFSPQFFFFFFFFSFVSTKLLGSGLLSAFSSVGLALQFVYPDYPWELSKFQIKGKKSAQRWLFVQLQKLLPNYVILEDYNHPDLFWTGNLTHYYYR